ncbi:MAG TPA: alginate lyase family protein [Myxococcota bacterium]|nr:alginate lyase family protein [Myxococcales bacterium]HPG25270.1 alginate lyase family protein [Myxococcota bacterium]
MGKGSTGIAAVAALAALVLLGARCEAGALEPDGRPAARLSDGLWISRAALAALPTSGPAWEALVAQARLPIPRPDLSNQDDPSNVRVLARALVAVRTADEGMATSVRAALRRVRGTERRATALAVGRELVAYVVAADLVGLEDEERAAFEAWLRRVAAQSFQGRSLRTTHEDRPNNWGTHAGATRLAIAAYVDDRREIARAAYVFRGWLGEIDGWQGFAFGALDWQADPRRPQAVNPRGAVRAGHPIGGVLPDDQRRSGPFRWPPPKENYVYEALQGAVTQAVLLERLGYDPWKWGDSALRRAFEWLHEEARYPAEGDDTWLPHLVNRAYGTRFPAPVPSRPGKGMGFSDWTHGAPAPPSPH